MGQGASKAQGSITFAHLAASAKMDGVLPSWDDEDPILARPYLYGLADKSHMSFPPPLCDISIPSSSSSMSTLASSSSRLSIHTAAPDRMGRTDSGYGENENRLLNDLAYVDKTYYNNRRPATHSREPKHPALSTITITFTDVAVASIDKTMQEVNLSSRSLGSLSPNIGLLTMIRKLVLSDNQLTKLPETIGYLQNLESLSIDNNQLKKLPDSIGHLSRLTELDVSNNCLTSLPSTSFYLKKLQTLNLSNNQLTNLPIDVIGMSNLATLDVSYNPLTILPAEIIQLAYLRRLILFECPLETTPEYSLTHDPPSLFEICARQVIRDQVPTHNLPDYLLNYLGTAKTCTSCQGPYFESHVVRSRLVERGDLMVPLEYRLCSAHWTDDQDRTLSMFSSRPPTSCVHRVFPSRRNLPPIPHHGSQKMTMLARRPRYASSSSHPTLSAGMDSAIQNDEDDLVNSPQKLLSGWRSAQRMRVMNRNHSGFLSLTTKLKRPANLYSNHSKR
ncbi:uncharacterized protein BYT42DRAFT_555829 [Radiomyces spectabilis]|uniref:uncharacterized protein n=1 Tax=Radiomyces spectabilis TaxID=64574 RepID=UPI00221EC975|nr:uncharacterized protein BYT42DRAFT_555829 [Radiomyces spectabilis]KAI8391158.1 hypothetical protein BYT42DRAFT_555829 [Radiomyces spectabilis]